MWRGYIARKTKKYTSQFDRFFHYGSFIVSIRILNFIRRADILRVTCTPLTIVSASNLSMNLWNETMNIMHTMDFRFYLSPMNPPQPPLLGPATWQHAHCMTGIKLQTNSVHKRSPIYGYVKPPRAKDSKRLGSIFVLLCEKMHGTTGKLLFHIFDRNYQLDFHPFLTLPSWWHGGISKTAHHLK